MTQRRLLQSRSLPWQLAELFAAANLAFLALDVWIAHSTNAFERAPEWIPVVFSLAAPLLLVVAAVVGGITPREDYPLYTAGAPARVRFARALGFLVAWTSIAVGVGGMLFHLQSHFFEEQTIRNLVYTAPFIAPLAYTGLGLLLVLDRTCDSSSAEWSQWVIVLALGGFVGNFGLSLADHAQNGFFNPYEWIPVAAAAFAVAFLLLAVMRPHDDRLLRSSALVMLLQMFVGIAGFAFHVNANLRGPRTSLWSKFVYGAPAFAPLLFANLALLAAIGLWSLRRRVALESGRP